MSNYLKSILELGFSFTKFAEDFLKEDPELQQKIFYRLQKKKVDKLVFLELEDLTGQIAGYFEESQIPRRIFKDEILAISGSYLKKVKPTIKISKIFSILSQKKGSLSTKDFPFVAVISDIHF